MPKATAKQLEYYEDLCESLNKNTADGYEEATASEMYERIGELKLELENKELEAEDDEDSTFDEETML